MLLWHVHSTHWQLWFTLLSYAPVDICVDIVPVDSVPVDIIPVDIIPADTVPADTVPVDIVCADFVRVDWESRLGTFAPSARLLQFDVNEWMLVFLLPLMQAQSIVTSKWIFLGYTSRKENVFFRTLSKRGGGDWGRPGGLQGGDDWVFRIADSPAMSFVFVCWQIDIRNTNQFSWAIN